LCTAKEDFRGKPQVTLLEARLQQSVTQVEKGAGPHLVGGEAF
jgi:hypothetical protein